MIEFYDPQIARDVRFNTIWTRFPTIQIMFTSGMAGWSWGAKWRGQVLAESSFLSPELALEHCIRTLEANTVVWQIYPFASKPVMENKDLQKYLAKWTKKHGGK